MLPQALRSQLSVHLGTCPVSMFGPCRTRCAPAWPSGTHLNLSRCLCFSHTGSHVALLAAALATTNT